MNFLGKLFQLKKKICLLTVTGALKTIPLDKLQNPSNDAQLPNAEEINITFSMRRKESEINGPSPSSLVFEKTTGYQFVSSRLTSFENLPVKSNLLFIVSFHENSEY
ncbi:hypothetical protein ERO13_D12G001150v2 [Gossypium hirsutum]|uniref:Uncharacterized protein n=1 Tax=Gossypium darwinii TaxID=34276 RepID=A0A5D2A6Z1_GOSDA|nr:hypothetical protein ERO13_D12G001150v2 [Gossypium hirsutum]TYG39252.1 hypothetical protein ES288_D12G001500v1 [Gossypium darwinii]